MFICHDKRLQVTWEANIGPYPFNLQLFMVDGHILNMLFNPSLGKHDSFDIC
jgi:hypothetical protein